MARQQTAASRDAIQSTPPGSSPVKGAAGRLRERFRQREARIAVVGLGYVGLPTAISFARAGFLVTGADIDAERVRTLNEGKSPLREIDGTEEIGALVGQGRFQATTDVQAACHSADAVLLIVPTPVTRDKQPDLSFVRSAAEAAAQAARPGQLVVLESTTYPGTTEEIVVDAIQRLSPLRVGEEIGVAYCPERYNPGDPQHTLANVHRVVGAVNAEWAEAAATLYGLLNEGRVTVVRDLKTAEAAKVIENVQRDLNIALVNELALIFERLGIDALEVLEAAATKWNFVPYRPGPGVGGHCLPVDPYYLTSLAERVGYHPRVILAGRAVNDGMPLHVVDLVTRALNGVRKSVNGSRVAILGLAYKANTADGREAPSHVIVKTLQDLGADVHLSDCYIPDSQVRAMFDLPNETILDVLGNADAVVMLTDHDEFRAITPRDIAANAAPACVVVDTRAVFDPREVRQAGLEYVGLGRAPA